MGYVIIINQVIVIFKCNCDSQLHLKITITWFIIYLPHNLWGIAIIQQKKLFLVLSIDFV